MLDRVINPYRIQRWWRLADRAIRLSDSWQRLSLDDLAVQARQLSGRIWSGSPVREHRVELGAVVREAARRLLGTPHYHVQLVGGFAILEGNIAEMQTGEGKTLTAILPAFARASAAHGCHVLTSNDYLAERDAAKLRPVYELLGQSVGCVIAEMEPEQRRAAYRCDVTYSTAKEVGFDFLRDRIARGVSTTAHEIPRVTLMRSDQEPLQRGHYFALVDEADAILIDEATTPLIISAPESPDPPTVSLYRWASRFCQTLDPTADFDFDAKRRQVRLGESGCRLALLAPKPAILNRIETERIYTQVENALCARLAYLRDKEYVVVDGKVVIVDESTGRIMDGRKWQDGIHQAIEAKEHLPISGSTGSAAQIASQAYFKLYTHLGGMTGTAASARRELKKTYELRVASVPPHRRNQRRGFRPRVFVTANAKWRAIAQEVQAYVRGGRPVLVGTPSVESSECLGAVLAELGITASILNAKFHRQEAEIIARAGQPGSVTIATNMAGRGTDILLEGQVKSAGGLHVIATEIHSSPRIDRQLVGRAGRQGDPGSFRFFMSLDDELLRVLPQSRRKLLQRWAAWMAIRGELPSSFARLFRATQSGLERRGRSQRGRMLKFEQQRKERYDLLCLDPYLEYVS